MPRPLPITLCVALLAAVLLAPAPASAKNLQAATICGPDACREVPKDQLSIHLVEGGGSSTGPERPEPWYRVRVTVGAGGAHDSWGIVVLPRGGYTGYPDGPGANYQWGTIDDSVAATYRRLAGDLQPFPAAQLRQPREVRVTEATPPPPAPEPEAGDHGVAIAGAIAGGILLVAAGFSLWKRRGDRHG